MMTAEELNAHIADGTINEVIRVAEARQVKDLSRIADTISSNGDLRLILVTGASAAGKTTTAKRLCTQLLVNECPAAIHLSTDDYFVGDKANPRDENGNLDYEHVECVDIRRLAADINALLRGEAIPRRRFDFIKHEPAYSDEYFSLAPGGTVVLEGIHALNPRLTEGIDDRCKFRVFIEPKPDLDVFGGFFLEPSDVRFLRRMVRDSQFRKLSPVNTCKLWPNVLAGEKKWIEPFRGNADATFNSHLVYELAALKYFVGGLLVTALREFGEHPFLKELAHALRCVEPITPEAIPGDSILRETIGGSQLEY